METKQLKLLKIITILIWTIAIIAGIFLFNYKKDNKETLNTTENNKLKKTELPVDFASKGILEKFADNSDLGHKNVNAFIYKILPNIFTNWDEKNLFKHFSSNKNSLENIKNLKKQLMALSAMVRFQNLREKKLLMIF